MRGRIKRFIEDKGYGFITGEDGQDYYFHISQVTDMVEIKNWMIVNFDVIDGKKGKNAVNIRVSEQNNTSRFITCGNTNIRLNNIKQYGLGKYPVLYEKIYDVKEVVMVSFWDRVRYGDVRKYYEFSGEWEYQGLVDEIRGAHYIEDERLVKRKGKGVVRERCHPLRDDGLGAIPVDEHYKTVMKPYLYITTYQDDNFIFKETKVNFDVVEKYNEINNAMQYGH